MPNRFLRFTSRVGLVLFLSCSPSIYAVELPEWFKQSFLNLKDDLAEANRANKRLLVIFHQDNCSYCQALVERNLSQRSTETLMRERFDVVAINIWGDQWMTGVDGTRSTEKQFSASQGVQFTPTVLFYDEAGKTVLRLNGYLPPPRFQAALEYIAQHKESAMPFREFSRPLQAESQGALQGTDILRAGQFDFSRGTTGRPVAVFFEQADCPDCVALHQDALTRRDIRDLLRSFDAVQIDRWSRHVMVTPLGRRQPVREWADELDIRYAPTIVLFDAHGREIIRTDAHFKGFHAPSMLDYVASGAYKTEPDFQRYLLARRARETRQTGVQP